MNLVEAAGRTYLQSITPALEIAAREWREADPETRAVIELVVEALLGCEVAAGTWLAGVRRGR